jgi:tetratricopeptide (TPR) repeat protein
MPHPAVLLLVALSASFTLATFLEHVLAAHAPRGDDGNSIMEILMGESRRLLASHFFVKADVYFHSGNYPTIFDENLMGNERHMENILVDQHHHEHHDDHEHQAGGTAGNDHELPPMTKPSSDFLAQFGEFFRPSRHVHLEEGAEVQEILPWLSVSMQLDPHREETYVVAGYWLRALMRRVDEAEAVLRQGWRQNPDSYAILFEYGRLLWLDRRDPVRARNIWELALRKWRQSAAPVETKDPLAYREMLGHLAQLESQTGRLDAALAYLEELYRIAPTEAIQKWLNDVRLQKNSTSNSAPKPTPPAP